MRTTLLAATALLLAAPVALQAQAANADPALAAMHDQWKQMTVYVTKAAEQMPEADYKFRPVATVRTFAQLVAHVAGAQAHICATALGEKAPAEDAIEKGTLTKAAIATALKESTALCERAYAMKSAGATRTVSLFGSKFTGYGALALNAVHNGEHYGNVVTYFRVKGMTPPSAQ